MMRFTLSNSGLENGHDGHVSPCISKDIEKLMKKAINYGPLERLRVHCTYDAATRTVRVIPGSGPGSRVYNKTKSAKQKMLAVSIGSEHVPGMTSFGKITWEGDRLMQCFDKETGIITVILPPDDELPEPEPKGKKHKQEGPAQVAQQPLPINDAAAEQVIVQALQDKAEVVKSLLDPEARPFTASLRRGETIINAAFTKADWDTVLGLFTSNMEG